jgi:hypothetical protein
MAEQRTPMSVRGYTEQSMSNIATVNSHKCMEERILRQIDALLEQEAVDPRWASIARTHIEQGFMALNRGVFRPERTSLPEDGE